MPRKGRVPRREVAPDPVYKSELVARFINKIMKDGKKTLAQRIFYEAMNLVAERSKRDPLEVFEAAIRNVAPVLEVRPRRVGGATYQVPVEVRPERRLSLAMRWIVTFARERGERTMAQRLAGELLDAANNQGAAVRRKEEMHRMAEANRAFAHYRW
ncbi:MAG: 30S ribosomal protein S7 [Clostridia bacterium]|nr:30S ribosomal protein S7 [Clostridia bacterium]